MRALLTLVVFALLALGAWFVFANREAPMPLPNTPPMAPREDGGALAPPMHGEAPPAGAADGNVRIEAPATTTGPTGDVLVVQFGSNTPIAGAQVLYWPPTFDARTVTPELRSLAATDAEGLLQRVSPQLVSDADGRCRVPLNSANGQVVARQGDLRAEGWLRKDAQGPLVLALRPDRTLHVRVLDAAGQPAQGVAVVARSPGERESERLLGATDAAGCLVKEHLQAFAGVAPTRRLEVFASMPGGAGAPAFVEATDPPPEVVLRLPATGSVVVHVRDAAGAPIDPGMLGNPSVRLGTWTEKPADARAETDGVDRSDESVPIDAHGDAVFAFVALDRFIIADAGSWLRSEVVPGPTLATPRVEVTAREKADDTVFTGVLLDADGNPYADAQYFLACYYARGMSGTNANTGATGRFRIGFPGHAAGQSATLSFDTKMGRPADPQAVELAPRNVTTGRNDLGEVRLARYGVLAQGRAIGDSLPARLPVQLQIERQRNGAWQQEWNLRPEWQGASFSLRGGIAAGTPMRLVVQSDFFLPVEAIEFAAGATNLEIPLRRGGSLTATLLVDVGEVPARWIRLQRVDPPMTREERSRADDDSIRDARAAVDGKAQRAWLGLVPGRYRLEVRGDGAAEPLAVVDQIEVGEGPCTDPRLLAIDLRGRVRTLAIRAAGADGVAIARRDSFVIVRGGGDWNGFNLGNGVVTLAAAAAVDLLVIAPGHRAAFVDGVFDSRTIALEAAPATTFAFVLPTALPDSVKLWLFLYPRLELPKDTYLQLDTGRGMLANDFLVDEVVVGADGRALVSARFPGVHRLAVNLRGTTNSAEVGIEPRTATLPQGGELAVRLDAAAWSQALQKLSR